MMNVLVLVPPILTTLGSGWLFYILLTSLSDFYQRGWRRRLRRAVWLATRAPTDTGARLPNETEVYGLPDRLALWVIGFSVGGLVLTILAGFGSLFLLGLLAGLLPLWWRRRQLAQARFETRRQVGILIEDLQLRLGFSSTLGAALAGLAEEANPMEVVGARLRLQRDRLALEGPEAVLQRLADELRSRELRLLLARVRAARLGGGSTTEALRAAAADVSAEIAQQVETEIEGAPLRLVFPMLALLLPPLLALVLYPPASLLIEGLTGAGPGTLPGG